MSAPAPRSVDLRAVGVGAAAWLAALGVLSNARWLVVAAIVALVAWAVLRRSRAGAATAAAWALASVGAFASALLHQAALTQTPLNDLARQGATARVVAELTGDPAPEQGRFARRLAVDADVHELWFRGRHTRLRVPVRVLLPMSSDRVVRGSTVDFTATVRPPVRSEQAAVLTAHGAVQVVARPGRVTSTANAVRTAVRSAVSGQAAAPRALVPALVDGQGGGLPPQVVTDFRTTGLTHLLAVSGTNLTLIVGCLLVLARWAGVRGRALRAVGIVGVVGFVILAGTQPSVLRAAAMGSIALIGLGSGGRQRGVRALGIGVLLLVLTAPWLAASLGFVLSVVATAGILVLAPPWRDALCVWLPRWAAEGLAVPLAAQLVCTPVIAGISGQISLVAVGANLVAAPLVAPATVLGLLGGVLALIAVPVGQVVATPAAWCATGLIAIARTGAAVPLPTLVWSSGWLSLLLLTAICIAAALVIRSVLVRWWATTVAAGLLAVITLVPLPTPGWPPPGWVLVACSIGQGDGLVLRVGDHSGVVVDAGPDPHLMDQCLQRLSISSVPVIVLTHFHADHIDGLAGVLEGRKVGQIVTSPLADPAGGAQAVQRIARVAGVPVRAVQVGETTVLGSLRWEVLAPLRTSYPASDSPPNDASAVMLVDVAGIRILMMGDEERPSQADLHRQYPGLRADVLKVAHHGSSKQDIDLVNSLGARLAVISVGVHNDYGHPAAATLDLLQRAGMQVHRTDREGDVAVVVDPSGRLEAVARAVGPP